MAGDGGTDGGRTADPVAGGPFAAPRPLFWIAILFCTFQLVTAAYAPLSSQVIRALHVGFLVLVVFGMAAEGAGGRWRTARRLLFWLCGAAAFAAGLYQWVFEGQLILRAGDISATDMVVGTVAVVLLFEAARRMLGTALPSLCVAFVLYALFGQLLPSPLNHRGYGIDQVIEQYAFGTEGIYGTPTYVSSTYIFLFILFGSFLEQAGMIRLFTDIALGTVGHTRGGPAKVAVICSAMMGTINGSGVANVVTTGQFTIPLMKRFGYRPAFAAAVEATSSMGGQIMPPVMGAVAFIMAETLNIPYAEVCIAAAVPACLYFATAVWMVHLEAGKRGLLGIPKAECPNAGAALRRQGHLLIPLVGLVYLLFAGYTPLFAGLVGLALTTLLILGAPIAASLRVLWLRLVFWVAIGAGTALFFHYGITIVVVLIAVLVIVNLIVAGGRDTLKVAVRGMIEGVRHALPVGIACAIVGIIIGTLTLTGMAGVITQSIVALGRENLFLCLVLTMLVSITLGMGIPTIPNYIIVSSLTAPVLLKLGVPLIVSHMFVFYFGIMADLTPPVALAAFAASAIAQAPPLRTGLEAVRVAIAGFVVPYMAIYDPALMLQGGNFPDSIYMIVKALCAIGLWGAAAIGQWRSPLAAWERALAVAAAFSLVVAHPASDAAGLLLGAVFVIVHLWRTRVRATRPDRVPR